MVITQLVYSQDNRMKIYGVFGFQMNNFASKFNTNLTPEIYSFNSGVGAKYYFKHFFSGAEFYNANGVQNTQAEKINFSGFSSTMFAGYKFGITSGISIEPSLGIGMLLNKAIINNSEQIKTRAYTKNTAVFNPTLSLNYLENKPIYFGIRWGYNLGLNNNSNWLNDANDKPSNFTDNNNSFFIQFTCGANLSFKKK
ncbi:hypothetical protein GCM10011514_01330 [Emticicia aquatilis]|uniref:Outer membrane protein beta-barrel domain-containing protein n=2 Tax=Emticicia aquatilis TaxID=1537369 RepID=A0A917DJ01_9BACT|nr:hypothetical protein GCM10011514_01330 [Emticicia aquatilis]